MQSPYYSYCCKLFGADVKPFISECHFIWEKSIIMKCWIISTAWKKTRRIHLCSCRIICGEFLTLLIKGNWADFLAYASLQPSVIENMTEFKRSLPLFPLVKPHINFMAAKLWRTPMDEEMQMISTDVVSGDFMMNKIIKDC